MKSIVVVKLKNEHQGCFYENQISTAKKVCKINVAEPANTDVFGILKQ
nr:hypothetical protein [uncultured Desulfobacter sp.]